MINKKLTIVYSIIILFSICVSGYSAPFFGTYFISNSEVDSNNFTTDNRLSFYLDHKFSDYVKFYTRLTGGFKFLVNYVDYESTNISNFSFIPNIDLFYFEFKSLRKEPEELTALKYKGETNFDLFRLRIGRVHVTQDSGFYFNMSGDGLDLLFTLRNFSFGIFGITNSFDYLPFFDFIGGGSKPEFTNWDKKRYPTLTNYYIEGNTNGFISDPKSPDYNFYFDDTTTNDYTKSEQRRLNMLRMQSIIAGRVFTGFTFKFRQIMFQNFSLNFLANVDLIPEDFVVTYKKAQSIHTFGGKYTSFYFTANANGKIYRNLYYNFEALFETGYTATRYSLSDTKPIDELILSFALNAKFSYFFEHVTKPTAHVEFLYAHGDEDAEYNNELFVNKSGYDNSFHAPNPPVIGFAVQPVFTNLAVIKLSQTIKPLAFLQKNSMFSRFSVESVVLIFMRPIIKGNTFLVDKAEFKSGDKKDSALKAYLGVEFDLNLEWAIFSDLKVQLRGGIFVPNSVIYVNGLEPIGRLGLSFNISL